MRRHAEAFGSLLLLCAFCYVVASCVLGCEPPRNAHEAAAEVSYGAALQRCVDKHATEAAMDACAADVRRRWDGGAP